MLISIGKIILHREAPCLKGRIFLIRDFTSLKLKRRVLFRFELYTNGLSWLTIPWHYTSKRMKYNKFLYLQENTTEGIEQILNSFELETACTV
jgi:hypothetical protein